MATTAVGLPGTKPPPWSANSPYPQIPPPAPLGAGARYAATIAWPTAQAAFPATVFAVNLLGSALIGILMVSVVQMWPHRRLVRPILGTGVLGGFTTFSTYAVDVSQLDHCWTGRHGHGIRDPHTRSWQRWALPW